MTHPNTDHAVLLLQCHVNDDAVAHIARFFADRNQPLNKLEQFTDGELQLIRATWQVAKEVSTKGDQSAAQLAAELTRVLGHSPSRETELNIRFGQQGFTVGLLCSTQIHVLNDVLSMTMANSQVRVPFVIGVNEAAGRVADRFGVPYFCLPDSLSAQELARRQSEIIRRYRPDVLGLARYDALLAQSVIDAANCPILAVHNSFLRTVKGEKAFQLAHEQGVKLLGATTRFVETKAAGPIILQDAVKLGPGLSQAQVIALGQQVEQSVFTESLRKLVEHKVMVYNAKTIVFD